jgi:PAS domain S-box-containing protein
MKADLEIANAQLSSFEELTDTLEAMTEKLSESGELHKKRERLFRFLIEINPMAHIVFDLEGKIIFTNHSCLRMTEYNSEEIPSAHLLIDKVFPKYSEELKASLERIRVTPNKEKIGHKCELITKNNNTKEVIIFFNHAQIEDTSFIVVNVIDITDFSKLINTSCNEG